MARLTQPSPADQSAPAAQSVTSPSDSEERDGLESDKQTELKGLRAELDRCYKANVGFTVLHISDRLTTAEAQAGDKGGKDIRVLESQM
jgi:hypothetical protein